MSGGEFLNEDVPQPRDDDREGVLTRRMPAEEACLLNQRPAPDHVEAGETKQVHVGDRRGDGTRNLITPQQPVHCSSPPGATRMLDVSDLVDRLADIQVSSSQRGTERTGRQRDDGSESNAGESRHDDDDPVIIRTGFHQVTAGSVPLKGMDDEHDHLLEHTESTHDETLSVAERVHGEFKGNQEGDGSKDGDYSVMTGGSIGTDGGSHRIRHQRWRHRQRPRHLPESSHSNEDEDEEHESNDTSCFSLDAMVGHSSCESSVTWYEGSQIEEVTVDDDDPHDESHEDVLLQSSSRDDDHDHDHDEEVEVDIGTMDNDDVVVYEDDETMFEWTSTESFFEESDSEFEQEVVSSSSGSSCTSPLSSSPPPPLPLSGTPHLQP